eukprot:1548273-Alexandrium_andersonii.AAC.1
MSGGRGLACNSAITVVRCTRASPAHTWRSTTQRHPRAGAPVGRPAGWSPRCPRGMGGVVERMGQWSGAPGRKGWE